MMLFGGWLGLGAEPLVLTFTGDLMAHTGNQAMADYDEIYRSLAPWLLTDDFSFINLETPIDPERATSDYPQFNAHPAYAEAAVRGGFQVFALANNHANDFGTSSVEATLKTLKDLAAPGIAWSGLREKASDPIVPVVLEKGGWKIGFVSLTNLINQWPGSSRVNLVNVWGIWDKKAHPGAQQALLDQIHAWRSGVDVLVVGFHDGVEYASEPDPIQIEFDRKMVEAGVDVLWGHHPHVLQPWEWVATDRGPRLLMYSLGNFVSRQSSRLGPRDGTKPLARTGDGALMQVTLTQGTGGIGLSVVPVPLNNYLDPRKGTVVIPTATLVDQAPAEWQAYYQSRWAVQQAWATPGD
jgi:poly-gamma-glutamate synthesis protein (capsule biosynthesis protein)